MKDFYICDASKQENKTVVSSFVVASKQAKPKKTGDIYLAITLADCTGTIEAKIWDNVPESIETFDQDDFIKVKGLINKYNNRFQMTVHKLRRLQDDEIDFADYLPKTTKDINALWTSLLEFIASIQNPHLRNLIQAFTTDPEIANAYRTAPAAKTLHHAFIGGLLDHVVSLFRSCDLTSRNYPQINRDLLLSGAFFHDIGKLHELTYARSFSYTTRGQLLGHMIIELEMLGQKLKQFPDFPDELKVLLEHMIISHHGQYEFGSPKLPMFPEALMLHYLDDLDSKMESMRTQFEREFASDEAWTSYNPSLGRPLLNSAKFLAKKSSPPAAKTEEASKRIEIVVEGASAAAEPEKSQGSLSSDAAESCASTTKPI